MVRRSESQFKIDDRAFPVRVKIVVPDQGLGGISDRIRTWLKEELGHLRHGWGPAHSTGCRQATAYDFRSTEDAQRFVDAFPELELADGVGSSVHTSPAKTAGPNAKSPLPHTAGPGPRGSAAGRSSSPDKRPGRAKGEINPRDRRPR